jgi:hypothetical protein
MEGGPVEIMNPPVTTVNEKEKMLGNKRERNLKNKDQKDKDIREEIEESKDFVYRQN